MDIIVCVKQVPDTLEVNVNRETNTLIRQGVESVINPFDLNGIEQGLRLKEQYGATVVFEAGPKGSVTRAKRPQDDFMYDEDIGEGVEFDAAELSRYGRNPI